MDGLTAQLLYTGQEEEEPINSVDKISTELWSGPSQLQCQQNWPLDINTAPTVETEIEAKKIQEILGVLVESNDQNDEISKKFTA